MDVKILENLLQVTIDRGNLRQLLGTHCKKLTLIVRNLFSAEMDIPKVEMTHDRLGKPEKLNHQEEADSETCDFVWGSDAAEYVNTEKDQVRSRKECRTLQSQVTNIQ